VSEALPGSLGTAETKRESLGGGGDDEATGRWWRLALGSAAALLPFAVVEVVPSMDLPQHLAQVRLLQEWWGAAPQTVDWSLLDVRWTAPNVLVYLPLCAAVAVGGPVAGGRWAVAALALAQVLTLHGVAARRGRSPDAALAAGVLVFNASLYAGFLNFLLAVPLFWLLVDRVTRPPTPSVREAAATGALATLLYSAHSLAFVLGCLVTVSATWVRRDRPIAAAWRAVGFLPAVALSGFWLPRLAAFRAAAGFDVAAHWELDPVERVLHLRDGAFGGVAGALEPVTYLLVCGLAVAWVWRCRGVFSADADRPLAAVVAGLGLLLLVLPDRAMNTLLLAQRFVPVTLALGWLVLPRDPAPSRGITAWAVVAVVGMSLGTAWVWRSFERVELTGMADALAAVPPGGRVIGLDLQKSSPRLLGRPFMQLFAYGQALHGGEGNFSFAEHGSSVVSYRAPRRDGHTIGLEQYPEWATDADLARFDVAFVVGDAAQHAQFDDRPGVRPLTDGGVIRLYALGVTDP
jgi:hypothetical protein